MSDLIIREALIKKAFTYEIGEKRTAKVVFLSDVQKAKTVDAVEVVRCGECKYYIYQWKSDDEQVYGLCGIHGTADLKSTDFCSYGKRKEVSE